MSEGDDHGGGDPGTKQWRFETDGRVESSPTVVDGTVYVGSHDHHLYAVDADDGTEQWRFETKGRVKSSPTVAEGTAYIGSYDGNLYAVDADDGTERWRFETGIKGVVNSSPTIAEGTVYVGNIDENLYAVDTVDGTERWRFDTGNKVRSSPTVVNSTIYVGSHDHHLYAVDADDGTERWHFETGNKVGSSPTVIDGTVYVGSHDQHLYAVDADDGTERWRFETRRGVKTSPTMGEETVYFGSHDHHLYAVDVDDGTERWRFETKGWVGSSPTVADGTIYVGSHDHHLYAVDADDGTERWRFETDGWVESSPTVADGTIYVGSHDHHLYGMETAHEGSSEGSRVQQQTLGHHDRLASHSSHRSDQAGKAKVSRTAGVTEGVTGAGEPPVPDQVAVTSPPRRPLSRPDLTVEADLGGGGQAIVKKARVSEGPPEVVALREPITSQALTEDAIEGFVSRAETWATIDAREREKQRWSDSEHVVGVIATGEQPAPWIAMEYMDGGDLGELLADNPEGLPLAQAVWLGECICKGVEIAHNLGIAHLDLKPDNVLLKETEGWPWPKLADWGLARTLATETGTMEGRSVKYAAPEQFDADQFGDPDQLTDIFQVGKVVYALVTGAPPHTGSQFEVMHSVMGADQPAPPSSRRSEVPPELDATVQVALERDKTERYDSISAFRNALEAIRTGGRLPGAVVARGELS